jgi:3-methylcrotonyl-CoA carboxylase alpha subunit
MGPMSVSITRGMRTGEVIVETDGRVERMFAVAADDVAWVFHDGNVFRFEAAAGRRAAQQAHGSLSSPMPATVVSVNVEPGQTVTAGQTLIVLEAMKMELPVRAPGDGRVEAIHCRPGDLVQPHVSLIDLA